MAIRVLDAATVSRIAAGEVVERPASIAKEMVENALDAKATSITVDIREGGIEWLRVTDNGCGIPANETRVAFENHATSKLSNGDDLTDIRTLGFRGEALASIAAVAKVEMRTRTRDAQSGTLVRVEGGQFLGVSETGCPEGTSITVKDLFYNVPARRAFLKRASFEAGAIYDAVSRLALGNPGVSIRLINNGKTACHSFGDGKMRSAALAVFGRETAAKMEPIDVSEGAFRVYGLVGLRECAKSNRSQQFFFINGRTVRCQLLTYALEEACRERVTIGAHPICALHVVLPPAAVDVNVHPSKLEVRFRDETYFRTTAEALLKRALSEKDAMLDLNALTAPVADTAPDAPAVPPTESVLQMPTEEKLRRARESASQPDTDSVFTQFRTPSSSVLRESSLPPIKPTSVSLEEDTSENDAAPAKRQLPVHKTNAHARENPTQTQNAEQIRLESVDTSASGGNGNPVSVPGATASEAAEPSVDKRKPIPPYRVIGVFLHTYLLLEVNEALLLIDQHAAHERILFERFKKRLDMGAASQRLLTPIILRVTPKEMALIEENSDAIAEAGYDIEPFGEREMRIDAVPFLLGHSDLRPMLPEMLEELGQLRGAEVSRRLDAVIKLSCRKAIKAGDALTEEEISALVSDMLASDAPPTCPHGRPVARVITRSELEKMFWRI